MVTANGEKVTHGHAYQSNTNPAEWYFTAKIDHTDTVNRLHEIFNDFTIRLEEDVTYAINFKQHIIINLTEENFYLERLRKSMKQSVKQLNQHKHLQNKTPATLLFSKSKLSGYGGGSHREKHEWEVGQRGNYDDVDNGRSIKR